MVSSIVISMWQRKSQVKVSLTVAVIHFGVRLASETQTFSVRRNEHKYVRIPDAFKTAAQFDKKIIIFVSDTKTPCKNVPQHRLYGSRFPTVMHYDIQHS